MITNAVIYYTVVLYYHVVLCSAALIVVGKQYLRCTVLDHLIIARESFLIFGHVRLKYRVQLQVR